MRCQVWPCLYGVTGGPRLWDVSQTQFSHWWVEDEFQTILRIFDCDRGLPLSARFYVAWNIQVRNNPASFISLPMTTDTHMLLLVNTKYHKTHPKQLRWQVLCLCRKRIGLTEQESLRKGLQTQKRVSRIIFRLLRGWHFWFPCKGRGLGKRVWGQWSSVWNRCGMFVVLSLEIK